VNLFDPPEAKSLADFRTVDVHGYRVLVGRAPPSPSFSAMWALHPRHRPVVEMYGQEVAVPRWEQAYARDYWFTGRNTVSVPIPPILAPFLAFGQRLDPRINGLFLNWYDGDQGHYIGAHRDRTADLVHGTPIISVSCGASRVFRVRVPGVPFVDIPVDDGDVVVLPWATNEGVTHEVPHLERFGGRRISVTMRAFRETR
jgi:alkylated DNA repair dioxygenase AlkB